MGRITNRKVLKITYLIVKSIRLGYSCLTFIMNSVFHKDTGTESTMITVRIWGPFATVAPGLFILLVRKVNYYFFIYKKS